MFKEAPVAHQVVEPEYRTFSGSFRFEPGSVQLVEVNVPCGETVAFQPVLEQMKIAS